GRGKAKLGVDGTVRQAKRSGGPRAGFFDQRWGRLWKPRRRYIDRLLEERTSKGIGLVEDGQHLKPATPKQAFDSDFDTVDEIFHEQGWVPAIARAAGDDGRDPPENRGKRRRAVGADHALAPGQFERLDDAWISQCRRDGLGLGVDGDHAEAGRRQAGRVKALAHARFVAGSLDGVDRTMWDAKRRGGRRREQGPTIVD